jgi:hypothetical protein
MSALLREQGILDPSDVHFLRSLFDEIVAAKGVQRGSSAANDLADEIINLYLAGADEEDLRDALITSRAA